VGQWLGFVSSEIHKVIAPWLWSAETAESTKRVVHERLATRFSELDARLAANAYLTGDTFTVADAYAYAIVNWTQYLKIDLAPYPHLSAYMARVAARPKVHEALRAERLLEPGADPRKG
jgi:glutathione S-transferase